MTEERKQQLARFYKMLKELVAEEDNSLQWLFKVKFVLDGIKDLRKELEQ
jgi:hypothetical protein